MTRCTVRLKTAAGEMAREEIGKQAAFLSKSIGKVSFSEDGSAIEFDAADDEAADLQTALEGTANRIVRSLRSLERKVVFASTASPAFPANVPMDGVHFLGTGQVALSGVPLRLFQYFDRVFEAFGTPWRAEPLRTPTLIPFAGAFPLRLFPLFSAQRDLRVASARGIETHRRVSRPSSGSRRR